MNNSNLIKFAIARLDPREIPERNSPKAKKELYLRSKSASTASKPAPNPQVNKSQPKPVTSSSSFIGSQSSITGNKVLTEEEKDALLRQERASVKSNVPGLAKNINRFGAVALDFLMPGWRRTDTQNRFHELANYKASPSNYIGKTKYLDNRLRNNYSDIYGNLNNHY